MCVIDIETRNMLWAAILHGGALGWAVGTM